MTSEGRRLGLLGLSWAQYFHNKPDCCNEELEAIMAGAAYELWRRRRSSDGGGVPRGWLRQFGIKLASMMKIHRTVPGVDLSSILYDYRPCLNYCLRCYKQWP